MRSKYNVSSNKAKRTFEGIVFDSEMEMKFYRDVVLPNVQSGMITNFELQKKYELQPSFKRDGKTVRAIIYIADFYIEWSNGDIEVIDIKGMKTPEAQLKRKMMWYKYPELNYKWLTYVNKSVGWADYDDVKSLRNTRR